jgi:hypothetical protein
VKKLVILLIAAVMLLFLPLAARWLYFYDPAADGERPPVARPDLSQVAEPALAPQAFEDRSTPTTPGAVVVDLAHDNRVQMAELSVLRARLAARGQRLETLSDVGKLGDSLRYARALVVVSPGTAWKADEIERVLKFVEKGGRLLLITDPARYEVFYDEWGMFSALDSDVAHINDLAARFGLVFQADYLYNTVENEGNYRHIRFTDFSTHPLTAGLEQVVLPGAHSIVSQEGALVWTAGETRSSSSERAGPLAAAALVANGQVLGLGDLSFLLEPYNTLSDNDRFIANIADFLSGDGRRYELEDFPFFFADEVDLVYAGDSLLNQALLAPLSSLQDVLEKQGLSTALRTGEDPDRDTVVLGLYGDAGQAEPYLSALGITLIITPAGETAGDSQSPAPPDDAPEAGSAVESIQVDGLGEVAASSTALLAFQEEGSRQVLLLLAAAEDSLDKAVERLTTGDLSGCLFDEAGWLALCPVEEKEASSDRAERPEAEEKPAEPAPDAPEGEEPAQPAGAGASILVLSLDSGKGRYDGMTAVDDYVRILEEDFEVTTWSTAAQGLPEVGDVRGYDLVIWTAGDFEDAFGEAESGLLFALMLEEIPVLVSGAYIGDAAERAVQRDIQVKDASHPLARGFAADEVIPFVQAPSGSEYEIDVLSDLDDGETAIVFVRGPGSESSGAPSVAVVSDAVSNTRVVFAGFPLYLLPEAAQSRFVLNAVSWMLSSGEG